MNLILGKWTAISTLVLALMAGSGALAWKWQANAYGKQLADLASAYQADLAVISNAGAADVRQALEKQQAAQKALAALDEKTTKERIHDLEENERLRNDVAVGARRLRIAGSCRAGGGSVSGSDGAASLDDAGSVEISGAARRAVLDIRAGIIADRAALRALQEYVRSLCN